MPTYEIRNRNTGRILDAAAQADSEFSAGAGYDLATVTVEEISPNPVATVYTIAWPLETPRGTELVEVCSTGSLQTALSELDRENSSGDKNRILIEEPREINQQQARERRS